jgi:hypothetical protein
VRISKTIETQRHRDAENRNSSSMLSWSSSASPRLCAPIPYSYYRFVTVPQTRSGLPGRIAFVILRTGRSPPVALHAGLRRRSYDPVTEPDSTGSGEDLHLAVHEDFRTHGSPSAGSAALWHGRLFLGSPSAGSAVLWHGRPGFSVGAWACPAQSWHKGIKNIGECSPIDRR